MVIQFYNVGQLVRFSAFILVVYGFTCWKKVFFLPEGPSFMFLIYGFVVNSNNKLKFAV